MTVFHLTRNCVFIMPLLGHCKWKRVESGECAPNCEGGFKEAYYIITQEAAGGGNECPDFVKDNVTEIIECCGE